MKGEARSHLNFESRPVCLWSLPPLMEVCKKCSGMLNVLPYMVSVKRETQYLVARKW